MREITTHKIGEVNEAITVTALDEPGSGGANHCYRVQWACSGELPNPGCDGRVGISFQNGPIAEAGVNGITNEVLLAIVMDRLKGFHADPSRATITIWRWPCWESALLRLQERTRERLARGVEGTMKP